jgi:PII-like signaling protein
MRSKGGADGVEAPEQSLLLRIFVGEDHESGRLALHDAIVRKAREMEMAGVTVLRGVLGYGHSSRFHAAKAIRRSMDLPLVIEIVDSEEKVNAFLPVLDEIVTSGLVTVERAQVIR